MAEEQSTQYSGSLLTKDLKENLSMLDALAVKNRQAENIMSEENTISSLVGRSSQPKIYGLGKLQGLNTFAKRYRPKTTRTSG
jgi:hypothetical protein